MSASSRSLLRRRVSGILALLPVFAAFHHPPAAAQAQPAPAPATAQSKEALNDGGGTPGVLQSIFIPPLPNAPFSLTLRTEWTRPMNNGGNFTVVNARPIRRDSTGRIYQERWGLVPKGSGIESHGYLIQIADPVARTLYQCSIAERVCELYTWNMPPSGRYQPEGPTRSTPLQDGKGFYSHEDLGTAEVEGVPVHLFRDITTLNPGTFGNDRALVTTREFGYSAHLGINLRSVLDTPQVGRQQFLANDISLTEPEQRFFQPPEGYRVIDKRQASPGN